MRDDFDENPFEDDIETGEKFSNRRKDLFCPYCGARIKGVANFCQNCGLWMMTLFLHNIKHDNQIFCKTL